jgi:hypothetical protein
MPNDKFIVQLSSSTEVFRKGGKAYLSLYEALSLEIDGYRALNKEARKQSQTTLETSLASATADPDRTAAIRQYELDYEASSILRNAVEDKIATICQQQQFALAKTQITPEVVGIDVTRQGGPAALSDPPTVRMGRILSGAARFKRLDNQPAFAVNTIYVHLENHRHYIQDSQSIFIRRFMWRAVNESDYKGINASGGLFAPVQDQTVTRKEAEKYGKKYKYKEGDAIGLDDAVFFHRQQGNNRFVSVSSTANSIYGNGGTAFIANSYERPKAKQTKRKKYDVNNFIIVDLSRISSKSIVDVHRPEAIKRILGMSDTDYSSSVGTQTGKTDEQKAARDTLRTRETLVKAAIPLSAVVYTSWDEEYNKNKVTLDLDGRAEITSLM